MYIIKSIKKINIKIFKSISIRSISLIILLLNIYKKKKSMQN